MVFAGNVAVGHTGMIFQSAKRWPPTIAGAFFRSEGAVQTNVPIQTGGIMSDPAQSDIG